MIYWKVLVRNYIRIGTVKGRNFYFYFDITLEIRRYSAMECFAAKKKIL